MPNRLRKTDMPEDEEVIILRREFEQHVKEEHERWDHLIKITEANAEAVSELTKSTQGIVDTWQAAEGVVKVGSALGRLGKWLAGLAFIGTFFTLLFDKFQN